MERRIFGKIFKNATAMHRHFCPKAELEECYLTVNQKTMVRGILNVY